MHLTQRHKLCYMAHDFEPSDWLRFILLAPFDRKWRELGLDDKALTALQITIMAGPTRSPVVRHTGGLRKIRFAPPGSQQGKSGGFRIGYVFFESYGIVLLVVAYRKNEDKDLNMADCNAIRHIIGLIGDQLERGEIR